MTGAALCLVAGCAKDPLRVDRNRPPRTYLVAAPVDSSITGENAGYTSYRLHLYWRGEDPDGYVAGFLWSFDDSSIGNFRYTTKTDSIFEVTVNDSSAITGGSTVLGVSRVHTFFIRAVDNLGKADPNLAIYNRTTYKATTVPPKVQFVGGLPSGAGIDTLSDGQPFRICWTGDDSDGVVVRYKFDVGAYSSPLRSDTCAFFNDPNTPGSVALSSGLYAMTVTAVDNAFAVGKTSFLFVVNHDPETWFEPKGSPIGHYIQPFLEGTVTGGSVQGTFAQGDTIPYRSTVWFTWDGEDVTGGETNELTGFSLFLRNGTRNKDEPYAIGFIDSLPLPPLPPVVGFKTNNPAVLGPLGFTNLILDSLDAGINMILLVSSRDASNRADGTPAAFRFHCNRKPELRGNLTVTDSFAFVDPVYGFEFGKAIYWNSYDFEDGEALKAKVTLDAKNNVLLNQGEQVIFIPDRVFRSLAPNNPHQVEVRVFDRADFQSDESRTIQFDVF